MLEPREVERWERLTAAMIRKAGADDPEAFAQVAAILATIPDMMSAAADSLRTPTVLPDGTTVPGYSWADIGQALGVTRSAAQQRYGRGRSNPVPGGDTQRLGA